MTQSDGSPRRTWLSWEDIAELFIGPVDDDLIRDAPIEDPVTDPWIGRVEGRGLVRS